MPKLRYSEKEYNLFCIKYGSISFKVKNISVSVEMKVLKTPTAFVFPSFTIFLEMSHEQ